MSITISASSFLTNLILISYKGKYRDKKRKKGILISAFLFLTNLCSIFAKNSLVVVTFSNIELLNASRMTFFMIIINM